MKTIKEHNDEVQKYYGTKKHLTNIECPNCSSELQYARPGVLMLSYPPQQDVVCFTCNYTGRVYSY